MIHLFCQNGLRLAYDPVSLALLEPDDLAWALLQRYNTSEGQRPAAAAITDIVETFGGTAVDGCLAEIDQLIASGDLFAAEQSVSREQLYPDGPRIKSMCLHLCHDCNLRCRYCFAGTGDFGTGRRSMLSVETGQRAVDFLIDASGPRRNLDIDFFGGEPLLNWPVVIALTEYIERRGPETGKNIRLTITTNAILLDEAKTAFINAHFANCVLSVDGRPETHDRMRPDAGGNPSYERVARNIRRFVSKRGDQSYYIRGTFTHMNVDFVPDVLALAELGEQISLEPVVLPSDHELALQPDDLPAIGQAYEKLAEVMLEAERKQRPFHFFHFATGGEKGPCSFKRRKGCGVGSEYVAVTPEGDIYPCHQFVGQESFRLGNVLDQPIILDPSVQAPFLDLLLPDKPDCQTCWARYSCSGGCAANAWHASGDVRGIYELGCAMQRKRLECALYLMAKRKNDDLMQEFAIS